MTEIEIKAVKVVEEIVSDELDDYSYFEGWKVIEAEERDDETVSVYVEVPNGNDLHFMVDRDAVEIEIGEDCWYSIVTYDWRVKYFWMALLSWD